MINGNNPNGAKNSTHFTPPRYLTEVQNGLLIDTPAAHALLHYAQLCGIQLEREEQPRLEGQGPAMKFDAEAVAYAIAKIHGVYITEMISNWYCVDRVLEAHKLKPIPEAYRLKSLGLPIILN